MTKKRKQFSRSLKSSVWAKTDGRCWYCGYPNNPFSKEFCIDHVMPFSKGGKDTIDNLVPCCRTCNSEKGAKSLSEYRKAKHKQFIEDYIVPARDDYIYTFFFETFTIGSDS